MEKNLLNRAVGFFWKMFQLNLLFAVGNIVLIAVTLSVVFRWITLPLFLLGIILLAPSLQALFLTIRRLDESEETSLVKLYIRCYREEFKGAVFFALGYISGSFLLFGAYLGLRFMPNQTPFIPVYALIAIILYVHFIFGLLIRAKFDIGIKSTWRLGLYCISKYPLYALFIFGGTLIAGALINTFHQLILLGFIPMLIYLLTVSTEKMFSDITEVLNIPNNKEGNTNESEDDR